MLINNMDIHLAPFNILSLASYSYLSLSFLFSSNSFYFYSSISFFFLSSSSFYLISSSCIFLISSSLIFLYLYYQAIKFTSFSSNLSLDYFSKLFSNFNYIVNSKTSQNQINNKYKTMNLLSDIPPSI